MIVYSLFMFAAAIVLAVFAILISKGNANLINCYHEDRVTDKALYCKKISQSIWTLTTVLVVSGLIGLLGETDTMAVCAVGVLIVGIIYGIARLFSAQKKYGGGIF